MSDLTIACNLKMADGIGRQGLGLLSALKNDLKINIFPTSSLCDLVDVPSDLASYFQTPLQEFGKITFWTYILGLNESILSYHKKISSPLKIAYSMFESSRIPPLWTRILNSYYDCLVVPDNYLISVYQESGVKIPIFVLPLGILIEEFLKTPNKTEPNEIFTFGLTAGFWARKNHLKVLEAFKKVFAQNEKVKLKLHGRFGSYQKTIEEEVKKANLSNVEFSARPFSQQEYLEWFQSLDCYVFPSQGEGFSITPREALALGIPCILSDNTVHKTLLQSGYFLPLSAQNKILAYYEVFGQNIGEFYDCSVDDLAAWIQEVHQNYSKYLVLAQSGRQWVEAYLWKNLRPQYLSLLTGRNIELNSENWILSDKLMTKSEKLYKIYQEKII